MMFAMLLGPMAGCRIAECWRYAWNSRFPPKQQQTVIVSEPCVTSDACCAPACAPCSAVPMIAPGPVPAR
jgi:hypothetical protein